MSIDFLIRWLATYGFTRGSAKAETAKPKAAESGSVVSQSVRRLSHAESRDVRIAIKCAIARRLCV